VDSGNDIVDDELRRFHNEIVKESAPSNRIASGIKKLYIILLDAARRASEGVRISFLGNVWIL